MTIIEAIKSGKRFRRSSELYDNEESADYNWDDLDSYTVLSDRDNLIFSKEELLADDWEIEEKKVQITYEQLCRAYNKAWNYAPGANIIAGTMIERMAKELGL